jgi:hypothetical protein
LSEFLFYEDVLSFENGLPVLIRNVIIKLSKNFLERVQPRLKLSELWPRLNHHTPLTAVREINVISMWKILLIESHFAPDIVWHDVA